MAKNREKKTFKDESAKLKVEENFMLLDHSTIDDGKRQKKLSGFFQQY